LVMSARPPITVTTETIQRAKATNRTPPIATFAFIGAPRSWRQHRQHLQHADQMQIQKVIMVKIHKAIGQEFPTMKSGERILVKALSMPPSAVSASYKGLSSPALACKAASPASLSTSPTDSDSPHHSSALSWESEMSCSSSGVIPQADLTSNSNANRHALEAAMTAGRRLAIN